MKGVLRRLRGAIGHAVVRGGTWFTAAFAVFGAPTAAATLRIAQRSARALTADAAAKLALEQDEVRVLLG